MAAKDDILLGKKIDVSALSDDERLERDNDPLALTSGLKISAPALPYVRHTSDQGVRGRSSSI